LQKQLFLYYPDIVFYEQGAFLKYSTCLKHFGKRLQMVGIRPECMVCDDEKEEDETTCIHLDEFLENSINEAEQDTIK
jgi:hypothetical protein